MKSKFIKGLTIITLILSLAACESMDRQQRNTARGAVLGGVAGGLLGGDTASTLGGAALGGVIGSQVNKDRHYEGDNYRRDRSIKNTRKHHNKHHHWND